MEVEAHHHRSQASEVEEAEDLQRNRALAEEVAVDHHRIQALGVAVEAVRH